jgi:hypothetical protein
MSTMPSASPACPTASPSSPRPCRASRPSRSAPMSAPARGTRRRRRTASPTSSSTWPSRAPRGATPRHRARDRECRRPHQRLHRAREDRLLLQGAEGGHGLAADIIGDILCHSTFARGAGARARRDPAGDRPGERHAGRHRLRPFPGNRLSRQAMGRPVLGTEDTIKAMKRDALTGYMRATTAPEGAWSSPPPARSSTTRCSTWCAAFRRPARCRAATPEPARYTGGEFREERDLDQVHIVLGFPSVPATATRCTTRRSCSRRCSAAACPRACSRRSARSAAWSIPSIPSPRPSADGGLFADLCRHRREPGGGAGARRRSRSCARAEAT